MNLDIWGWILSGSEEGQSQNIVRLKHSFDTAEHETSYVIFSICWHPRDFKIEYNVLAFRSIFHSLESYTPIIDMSWEIS